MDSGCAAVFFFMFFAVQSAMATQEPYFEKTLLDFASDSAVVGLAAAVVRDGKISSVYTFGVRELGSNHKVTPETTFRVASLSKAFAATVAAQLDQEEKLSLDDSISLFNKDFRLKKTEQAKSATLEHVLSHRLSLPPYAYDNLLEAGATPPEILREMQKVDPICQVGSCYAYQNVGFNMIASAIEQADKQDYSVSVSQRLFEPLGMDGASFGKDNLIGNDNWARSYQRRRGTAWQTVSVKQPYYDVPAAGGVNANIVDMAKWLAAQFGNTPTVLPKELLNRLHRPLIKTPRELRRVRHMSQVTEAHYGLGWRIYQYAGNTVVNHSGSVEGYAAQMALLPDKNVGIVLLTNSKTRDFWYILPEFLDQELGL